MSGSVLARFFDNGPLLLRLWGAATIGLQVAWLDGPAWFAGALSLAWCWALDARDEYRTLR